MLARLTLPLLLLAASAPSPVLRYRLDAAHSDVSAKVAFFGLARKTAGFPKMTGAITLEPERPETVDLDVELDARALTAGDSITLARLKGQKFFDVEHYPTVRFSGRGMTMTGPRTATIAGNLTARGVTRPAKLDVSFAKPPAGARKGEPIALTGTTQIDRRSYGMTSYSLIVGRKVTITIRALMVPG